MWRGTGRAVAKGSEAMDRDRDPPSGKGSDDGLCASQKLNILGVTVSNTLTFSHHVTALIEKCARTLYALKTIRGHGLAGNALFDVARSTMVAQLLYASPAWWGFLKADEQNRLQSVVRKAQRSGFLPNSQKNSGWIEKGVRWNSFSLY